MTNYTLKALNLNSHDLYILNKKRGKKIQLNFLSILHEYFKNYLKHQKVLFRKINTSPSNRTFSLLLNL